MGWCIWILFWQDDSDDDSNDSDDLTNDPSVQDNKAISNKNIEGMEDSGENKDTVQPQISKVHKEKSRKKVDPYKVFEHLQLALEEVCTMYSSS